MAAETSSMRKKKPHGFMTLLSSAASEWFLIFLLFMEAALSYLLTKFAHYCELETPCLLCSRLDGCFWSLLCTHHKQEISSSVSCSIHSKFSDIHGMCEECLMSIAEQQSKSSPDSYKLLVGKSWVDVDRSVLQNLMLNKHIHRGSSDRRTCSCCNRIWRSKSNAERLLELSSSIGFGASKANVKPPLPRAPGRSRFSRRDSLKRLRDKFTGPLAHHASAAGSGKGIDTLSHVGYTKLKISSDSESEVPLSEDDDDGNTGFHGKTFAKSEYDVQFGGRRSIPKPPVEIEVSPSILDQPNLLDLSSFDASFIDHDKGGLNDLEEAHKQNPSSTTELISLFDGRPVETILSDVSLPHMSALSVLSEFLSICNVTPLSNTATVPNKIDVVGGASEEEEEEEEKEEDEDASLAKHIEAAAGTSSDEITELSDRQAFKQIKTCNSDQTHDYTKPLSRVSDSEMDSISKHDESTTYEDSSSSQVLPVSVPLKKNDSNYDSSDGATVSDVEGENIVDRLKRQIEHDRSCMNSLYKDLEEERNASAIAANQAMAMITRLQEEKAALHMEALQYLRMMEEQAEYDLEALERANDLLAEKEKELQDLEFEVEFYRNNFLDESGVHSIQKESSPGDSNNSTVANKISKANGNCKPMNGLVLDFEDEKIYILQCLRKLENKIHQGYLRGKLDDMPNGLNVGNHQDLPSNNETLLNQDNEDNRQKVISLSNGTQTRGKENDCLYEKSDKFSANVVGQKNSAIFEKEIAELYDRLEALESDRNFVKYASDILSNGKDGLELVQEIAHQLQEFRKMEFKRR